MVDVDAIIRNHSKEDFVWILENICYINKVVDDWNSLSAAQCVNSCNINAFKKHSSVQPEPESIIVITGCAVAPALC